MLLNYDGNDDDNQHDNDDDNDYDEFTRWNDDDNIQNTF